MLRVVKRKATGFFKKDDLAIVKTAIKQAHGVMRDASALVRAFYLRRYSPDIPCDGSERQRLTIDADLLSFACNVVQGVSKAPLRGQNTGNDAKRALYSELLTVWNDIASGGRRKTTLSLSHILSYSIDTLVTAYETNITTHFYSYAKRFILCDQLERHPELDTRTGRQQVCKLAHAILGPLMYDAPATEDAQELVDTYSHLVPPKRSGKPRCYDMKVDPWPYLEKMVDINRALEHSFPNVRPKNRKLFNPLPFHSSDIPNHIRLDTSGLAQLLMDQDRIKDFRRWYELLHGVAPAMNDKSDMLSSFQKLFGRHAVDGTEEALYATEMWKYITNLGTCKQAKDIFHHRKKGDTRWVFDNAVVTDGCSISFQIVQEHALQRKKRFGKKTPAAKPDDDQEDVLMKLEERVATRESVPLRKLVSVDPGKCDKLFLTDGARTLRFTKGQTDQDTCLKHRQKASLRLRRKNGLEEFETTELSQCSSKSCTYTTFKEYVRQRRTRAEQSERVYEHPFFRQSKFTAWSRQTASEMRFFATVVKTFTPDGEELPRHALPSRKHNRPTDAPTHKVRYPGSAPGIELAYGDWGRHPNALKGCAPSPGIGLRRRCERFFKAFTVPEHSTSQTCPCCKEKSLSKPSIKGITRHHLLRCTNEACLSRWWNRNVAGSLNILERAIQAVTAAPNNEQAPARRSRARAGRGRKHHLPNPRT